MCVFDVARKDLGASWHTGTGTLHASAMITPPMCVNAAPASRILVFGNKWAYGMCLTFGTRHRK